MLLHISIARKEWGGGVKARQANGLVFSEFARLTEGGRGLKLFGQYPYKTNTFQKGASLTRKSRQCLDVGGN